MEKDSSRMFCYQCEMSSPNGCGSAGQSIGTCGKNSTLAALQDLIVIGLKGLSAYREQAKQLGANTTPVDDVISDSLSFTMTNVNFNFDDHITQLMKVGKAGVKAMDMLSDAHTRELGVPTPVRVSQNKAEGKTILVSGHDLSMLKSLLKATKDKGINIYTHSEMLPAHGYPELRKYPHLKGNIGKSWFDQPELFERWSGAIIVNTNCIKPLKKNSTYGDRLFTYGTVGIEGGKKIQNDDFSEVIQKALSLPDVTGFTGDAALTTGHHYKSVISLAPQILDAVKSGKITRFYVIAGCDAPGKGGEYFRELAQGLKKDSVIITSSCGKFRFNDIDFGAIPQTDVPRYIDLGQCNDSNGAVHIAGALGEALGLPFADLPITIVLSWMEQKAVLILLALFSLGIKNIVIGPKPPEFITAEILSFLSEQFNLKLTSTVEQDFGTA